MVFIFTYWTFILTIVLYIFPLHHRITTLPLNIICLVGIGDVLFTNIPEIQIYSFCIHILPLTIAKRIELTRETIIFTLFVIASYILFIHGWCKKTVVNVYKVCMNTKFTSLRKMLYARFIKYK